MQEFSVTEASTVGSMSRLAFRSLQVQFPGLAHSFDSCQILVKGLALNTG